MLFKFFKMTDDMKYEKIQQLYLLNHLQSMLSPLYHKGWHLQDVFKLFEHNLTFTAKIVLSRTVHAKCYAVKDTWPLDKMRLKMTKSNTSKLFFFFSEGLIDENKENSAESAGKNFLKIPLDYLHFHGIEVRTVDLYISYIFILVSISLF